MTNQAKTRHAEAANGWTAECRDCGERMVAATLEEARQVLAAHIHATGHTQWLILASDTVPRRSPQR